MLLDENENWNYTAKNEVTKSILMNLQLNENFSEPKNVEVNVTAELPQLDGSNSQKGMFQDSVTEIGELSIASITSVKLEPLVMCMLDAILA